MATISIAKQPRPNGTDLTNIIDWINDGYCVILHTDVKCKYVFHKCTSKPEAEEIGLIYIHFKKRLEVLSEDNWPSYIAMAGLKTCTCDLKGRVAERGYQKFSVYQFSLY